VRDAIEREVLFSPSLPREGAGGGISTEVGSVRANELSDFTPPLDPLLSRGGKKSQASGVATAGVHELKAACARRRGAIQGSEIPPCDVPAKNDRDGRVRCAVLFARTTRLGTIPALPTRPFSHFRREAKVSTEALAKVDRNKTNLASLGLARRGRCAHWRLNHER